MAKIKYSLPQREWLKQTSGWRHTLLTIKDFLVRGASWGTLGLALGITVSSLFIASLPVALSILAVFVVGGITIGVVAGVANVYVNSQYRKIEQENITQLERLEIELDNLENLQFESLEKSQQQEIIYLIQKIISMNVAQRKALKAALPPGHCLKNVIPTEEVIDEPWLPHEMINALSTSIKSLEDPSEIESKITPESKKKQSLIAKMKGIFSGVDTTVMGFGVITSAITVGSFFIGVIAAIPAAITTVTALGFSVTLGALVSKLQRSVLEKINAQKEAIVHFKEVIKIQQLKSITALNALRIDLEIASSDFIFDNLPLAQQHPVIAHPPAENKAEPADKVAPQLQAKELQLSAPQKATIDKLLKPSSWLTLGFLWFKDFFRRAMGLTAIGVSVAVIIGIAFPPLLIPSLIMLVGTALGLAAGVSTVKYGSNYRSTEMEKIKKLQKLKLRWEHPERYSNRKSAVDTLITRILQKSLEERSRWDQSLPANHCLKGKLGLNEEALREAIAHFVAERASVVDVKMPPEKLSSTKKASAKGILSTAELGIAGSKVTSSVVALGGLLAANIVSAGTVAIGLIATLAGSILFGAVTAKVQRAYDIKNEKRDDIIKRLRFGINARKTVVDEALDEMLVSSEVSLQQAEKKEEAQRLASREAILQQNAHHLSLDFLTPKIGSNKYRIPNYPFGSEIGFAPATSSLETVHLKSIQPAARAC